MLRPTTQFLASGALWAVVCLSVTGARAEFEIQESTIDPGEIQLQYRGAWHSGLSPAELEEEEAGTLQLLPEVEEAPLRQSHDFELQISMTSRWLFALTHVLEEPSPGDLRLNAIELESQIELIEREGDGIGLAVQGGTEAPVRDPREVGDKDYHVGPIVELSKSNFTLVTNPLFFKLVGPNNDQEGIGFEYGWQGRYEMFGERLWLAVEMFGEIEDMSNAGAFNQQEHSIGPAFYYTFGADDDDGGEEDPYAKTRELTVSLGAQFGLTDVTSDVAVKVFIGYEFN